MEVTIREDLILASTKNFTRFLMKLVKPTNENKAALMEHLYAKNQLVLDFETVCSFSTESTYMEPFFRPMAKSCFSFDLPHTLHDESSPLDLNELPIRNLARPKRTSSLENLDRSSGAGIDGLFVGRNQVYTDNIDDIFNEQELINTYYSQKPSEPLNSPEQLRILLSANNGSKTLSFMSENFNQVPRRNSFGPAKPETLSDMLSPGINEMSENVEDQLSESQLLANPYENQNSEPLSIINNSVPEASVSRNVTFDDINQTEGQIHDDILNQQGFEGAYENQNGKESSKSQQERKDSTQENSMSNSSTSVGSKSQSPDQLKHYGQPKKIKVFKIIRENKQDKTIVTLHTQPSVKKNLYTLIISHAKTIIKDWSKLTEKERSQIPIVLKGTKVLKKKYVQLNVLQKKSKENPTDMKIRSRMQRIRNDLLEELKLARFSFLKEILGSIDHAAFLEYLKSELPNKQSMIAVKTKLKDSKFQSLFLKIIMKFLACDDIDSDPFKIQNVGLTYWIIKSPMEPENKLKLKDPEKLRELRKEFQKKECEKREVGQKSKKDFDYTSEDEEMEKEMESEKQKKKKTEVPSLASH